MYDNTKKKEKKKRIWWNQSKYNKMFDQIAIKTKKYLIEQMKAQLVIYNK